MLNILIFEPLQTTIIESEQFRTLFKDIPLKSNEECKDLFKKLVSEANNDSIDKPLCNTLLAHCDHTDSVKNRGARALELLFEKTLISSKQELLQNFVSLHSKIENFTAIEPNHFRSLNAVKGYAVGAAAYMASSQLINRVALPIVMDLLPAVTAILPLSAVTAGKFMLDNRRSIYIAGFALSLLLSKIEPNSITNVFNSTINSVGSTLYLDSALLKAQAQLTWTTATYFSEDLKKISDAITPVMMLLLSPFFPTSTLEKKDDNLRDENFNRLKNDWVTNLLNANPLENSPI